MFLILMIAILLLTFIFLGGYLLVNGIIEREGAGIALGFFIILFVVVPVWAIGYEFHQKENSTLTREEVTLTVSDKDYDSSWVQTISTGKTVSTIYHPEEWDVVFTDGERTRTIDDEALFNSLEIGDKVEGYRDTYTKANGKIYSIELKIKGYEGE